jgi:stage II sporulation protein D
VARPQDQSGLMTLNGKRFRGHFVVSGPDGGLTVVNHVPLEDYLRGVVAVEMGTRPRGDSMALQAQAVASRSYAYLRLGGRGDFDVRSTVLDQAYGGVDAENTEANAAVDATRGLMLRHQGRVADALYHSTCGGSTAEPPEVWRTAGSAYLQRVSDRIGETNRWYCDIAPRYRWTRTFSAQQLDEAVAQYLKAYAAVPVGGPGKVRHLAIQERTRSGRVGMLEVETERGAYPVRGDDIRSVIRVPGGEILSSTYFSLEPVYSSDGVLERVTFRGQGHGHGVGMCQWGAIGRARAGQSYRQILATYYPGTTVGPIQ